MTLPPMTLPRLLTSYLPISSAEDSEILPTEPEANYGCR